jgi:hypothetical protein
MGHQHPPPESSSRWLQKLGSLGYVASSGFEVLEKQFSPFQPPSVQSGFNAIQVTTTLYAKMSKMLKKWPA